MVKQETLEVILFLEVWKARQIRWFPGKLRYMEICASQGTSDENHLTWHDFSEGLNPTTGPRF